VYDAIVTMLTTGGKLNFDIKVLNDELHMLLPGGNINYQGKEGFKKLKTENEQVQSLIRSIVNSIEEHLTVQP